MSGGPMFRFKAFSHPRPQLLPILCGGLILFALAGPASAAPMSIQYSVKDLGNFVTQGTQALDQEGHAVVSSVVTGGHPYLYDGTKLVDLGTNGVPFASNSAGQVVGWYGVASTPDNTGLSHAFILNHGQFTDLGTLGGYSTALAVNDAGTAVGWSNLNPAVQSDPYYPVLFENGKVTAISTLPGIAAAINNAGTVVGDYGQSGQNHAFSYQNGVFHDLGTLGGATSSAFGINTNGQIVGYSATKSGVVDVFLYQNGAMSDLGHVTGNGHAVSTYAYGINDAGTIFGWHGAIPFVYSGGQFQDLTNLVDPKLGIEWLFINGINDAGQILAIGNVSDPSQPVSQEHTFLLTPVPEPASVTTTLLMALGLIRRRNVAREVRK